MWKVNRRTDEHQTNYDQQNSPEPAVQLSLKLFFSKWIIITAEYSRYRIALHNKLQPLQSQSYGFPHYIEVRK